MIRNRFWILTVIGLFFSINIFLSCSKVDDGDHTAPTIEVFSPVKDDILYVYRETDGVPSVFKARFTDDTALSSYTFRILHDKDTISRLAPGDTTAYIYRNYQSVSIFDTTEVTISHAFRIDSLVSVVNKDDKGSRSYPIWEGKYNLVASVVDKHGNMTSFDTIPVFIRYRDSKNK